MKILLASFLLASACVRLQADIPPICKTVSLEFPGVPAGATPAMKAQADQTFPFATGLKLSFLSQLRFAGGVVSPGNGAADLSFLDSLTLSVAAPAGSSLPEVQLVAWNKPASGVAARIEIPPQPADLVPYFVAGGMSLRVSMSGSPPPAGFSLLVDVCASASVDQTIHF
jgi:hypothetical protein